MILLDANLVIYAANPAYRSVQEFIARNDTGVSAVTYVEALGFHRLDPRDRTSLEQFFSSTPMYPVDRPVLDRAISLRQQRRLNLGDGLIAATALIHGIALATNNLRDFDRIVGLRLLNPLAAS